MTDQSIQPPPLPGPFSPEPEPVGVDLPPGAGAVQTRRLGWLRLGPALLLAMTAPFLLPLLVVVAHLFVGFSPLWSHLAETVLSGYVMNTLALVILVGGGTLVIGTLAAAAVTFLRFPLRGVLEWALVLPLAAPAYVVAYAYTDLLAYAGPVQTALRDAFGWRHGDYWFPEIHSLGGAAFVMSAVLYPYVYLMARASFAEQSLSALEASRVLGVSPWTSFRRVVLPMARPALVAGVSLAAMETLADFGTVQYFGVNTFTTGIYRAWFSHGDQAASAQLSCALLSLVVVLVACERWLRGDRRFHETSRKVRRIDPPRLTGWRAIAVTIPCVLPVLVGFLIPAGVLAAMAADVGAGAFDARYAGWVWNTVTLAGVSAAAAVTLGLAIAYGRRIWPGSLTRAAGGVARLGYAVPGSVIAVGVLLPFAWFDRTLDAWARETFDVSTGLILTGGIAALVFAYLVRFLGVAVYGVSSGLARIPPSMDAAARTLGRGPIATLRDVHVPMLRGSVVVAAIIVFVDVMKELPATLLMRPFNFDTLAVRAHNFAADERLAQAAAPSLTIIAAGILPVIILAWSMERR